MSLLLEALKKAEQAKQSGHAPDPETTLPGGEGLSLAPAAAPEPAVATTGAATERTPITRDRLPNIDHTTLEILSDDLPSTTGRDAPAGQVRSPERESTGARVGAARVAARAPSEARVDDFVQERDAARHFLEAGAKDYDPRRPFRITLLALGVAAVCIVAYFWWQTQPRSLRVTQPPATASSPTKIAPAPAPAPASSAAATPEPAAAPSVTAESSTADARPSSVPLASQPMQLTRQASSDPPAGAPAAAGQVRPSAAPRESARPQPAAARPAGDISVTRSASGISAALAAGYAAFHAGDLAAARHEYQRALAADARNRDALLGLAAVDIRNASYEDAERLYVRVLEIDPRDPDANAGMVSLRGRFDPVQSESRLKTLIATNPDAAALHFTLGNQFAIQRRWAEAQQAYFRAVTIEPENPDYVFNLGVSLDHLHQGKPALEHYQRAVALAGIRAASFNRSEVEIRIRELQR